MNIPGHGEFTIIGENIHTTRVVLRGGKLMGENPDGLPSVRYTAASGETRYLPIPEEIRRAQDYEEGRVKHVKVAVLEGMRGSSEALEYLGSMVARQLRAGSDFLDLNVDEVSLRPAAAMARSPRSVLPRANRWSAICAAYQVPRSASAASSASRFFSTRIFR